MTLSNPQRLWTQIRSELAPFPGRSMSMARIVLSIALVILIAMTLQIPFLSLSMIMVLFTAQESTLLTRIGGTMLLIGATLAIAFGLLLVKLTIDFPLLRIAGASLIALCAMYFMRISRLGSIGYLIAMFVFHIQSFVDLGYEPEALTRSLLWLWIAITYPIALTIGVYHLVQPPLPARMLDAEMTRQLDAVLARLAASYGRSKPPSRTADSLGRSALTMRRLQAVASKDGASHQQEASRRAGRVSAIERLDVASFHLSRMTARTLPAAHLSRIKRIETETLAFRDAIASRSRFNRTEARHAELSQHHPHDAVLQEMASALDAAAAAERASPASRPSSEPLWVADAFSNPAYGQFAFKTLLAAMVCYVLYTGQHWPGIHTSMLTCFILALPSLGASTHKGVLRIVGCALGSVVALVATVFITPHLDTIVGLLMLTLPVIGAGAWVAAGSQRVSYIGVQFVFAFALAQLGRFGPYNDIAEIRDRMIGILVGVAVSVGVSAFLWPEREADALKETTRRTLRSVAGFARAGYGRESAGTANTAATARLQSWALLAQLRDLHGRVGREPPRPGGEDVLARASSTLAHAPDAMLAIDWLRTLATFLGGHASAQAVVMAQAYSERVAERLEWLGDHLGSGDLENAAGGLPAAPTALEYGADVRSIDPLPGSADIIAAAKEVGRQIAALECFDAVTRHIVSGSHPCTSPS